MVVAHGDGSAVGEGHTLHEGGAEVQAGIHGHLVAVVDEVEITVVFHQLIAGLFDVVDIQVTVHHAVLLGWLLGERGDGFDGKQFTTGLAGLLLLPFHPGGRFGHGDPISGGMTQGGDCGLRHENFAASGTMLALGQTRFGAGGSHGGVGDLGVGMLGYGAYALGENHLTVRTKGVASHGNG